jgi:thiol:disulfide interchange protein DsbD
MLKLFRSRLGHTGMPWYLAFMFALVPLSATADVEHVQVSLLSERDALVPGATTWLGIRLQHEPHWHTYWINPGDSGLSTKLNWQLADGLRAGDIVWPMPERIRIGDLYNFGYEGDALLSVPIEVPNTVQAGTTERIGVEVKYLVCQEECIPGKVNLTLDLHVLAAASKGSQALFAAARAAQPQAIKSKGHAQMHDDRVEVILDGAGIADVSDAFVVQRKLVNYSPPQLAKNRDELTLSFDKSDYFVSAPAQLDLILRAGPRAWSVSVPFSSTP